MVLSSAEHLQHGLIDAARARACLAGHGDGDVGRRREWREVEREFSPGRLERARDRLDRLAAALDDQVRDRVLRLAASVTPMVTRVRCASLYDGVGAGWPFRMTRQTS
jgi:hypothetical protein